MVKYIFLIVLILFLVGCSKEISVEKFSKQSELSVKEQAINACKELCKNSNIDLSNGPCLSNEIMPDWVCDVAHSPRQSIDNNPENQCSAFRNGLAHHFVEIDENCELINFY